MMIGRYALWFGEIFILAFAALFSAGCRMETYRSDLFYETGGRTFAFTVAVTDEILYLSSMLDGERVDGTYGEMVPGGKFARVEAKDLNKDGNPEVYAFYPRDCSRPAGLTAVSCSESGCSAIGMGDLSGGRSPLDYCGGDAYSFKNGALVRQYTACTPEGKTLGFIRYKLKKEYFGLVLRNEG